MRLYSYCLPVDDGAAPNPFWGVCTLVICKPAIRRTARDGDWIAGTGSKQARTSRRKTVDLSGRLIYAMKVTQRMSLREYDAYARSTLPGKLPDRSNLDRLRHVGDAIYDYSVSPPAQRPSVHLEGNRKTDLAGECALLSNHFVYFGAAAIPLPVELRDIAQNQQGHRVKLNQPFLDNFVDWIETQPKGMQGEPAFYPFEGDRSAEWCAGCRKKDDEEDEEVLSSDC